MVGSFIIFSSISLVNQVGKTPKIPLLEHKTPEMPPSVLKF